MKKLKILPDWVYVFKVKPDLLKDLDLEHLDENWNPNEHNFIGSDKFLFKQKKFSNLTYWINKKLNLVKLDLNLKCERLEVCSMWVTKSIKNQWHHPHTHPTSWASGIIYFNESGSQTWFSKPNFWVTSRTVNICPDTENHIIHKFPTTPGTMIVFPSTLYHSVNEHDLDAPRYTLSFNAFPCGAVGDATNASALYLPPFSC